MTNEYYQNEIDKLYLEISKIRHDNKVKITKIKNEQFLKIQRLKMKINQLKDYQEKLSKNQS